MFDYTRKALKLVSRRWNTPSSRMTLVIFSWFASGSLIAFATIKFSSAFYLLVFIPISITFEYSMKKQVKHKPQKHRLPRLSLWVSMIITPLLAAAGYFRNPQKYHIFVILYIVGMLVLFFYGWMASRMSKSLEGTAEIDAITWLLKLETSPNPELFKKACRIVSSDSGRDYQPWRLYWMPLPHFFAATEHIFIEYNSYYSFLFGPAGNPQVPAKFWYGYPDPAGPVGMGWSGSAGAWSAGISWQVTC